jgi:hypothetical protein
MNLGDKGAWPTPLGELSLHTPKTQDQEKEFHKGENLTSKKIRVAMHLYRETP